MRLGLEELIGVDGFDNAVLLLRRRYMGRALLKLAGTYRDRGALLELGRRDVWSVLLWRRLWWSRRRGSRHGLRLLGCELWMRHGLLSGSRKGMLHLPRRRRRDLLRLMVGLMRLSVVRMGHILRMRSWRMVSVCAVAVMLLRVLLRVLLLVLVLLRVLLSMLLSMMLRMEVVRMVRLCLRLRVRVRVRHLLWLCLWLRIVRHGLQRLHLMVRRRQELAVRLVLLVANVGHRIRVPSSILLLVSRLRRHLRQAIIGLSRRLRAPIVVVVHGDDIWSRRESTLVPLQILGDSCAQLSISSIQSSRPPS